MNELSITKNNYTMSEDTVNYQASRASQPQPSFLPQPADIEKLMKETLILREINDEFGFTGEWRMSAKNVLDIIIDLQK